MPPPVISPDADVTLLPMTAELADRLGPAIAGMEPWSLYNRSAAYMTGVLANPDPAVRCRAVHIRGELAGAIAIRSPWMAGPLLQLLALLPPFQCKGHGGTLVNWFAALAKPNQRWLWLAVTAANGRAFAFYKRHGFEEAARLPDLMQDGSLEVLMRKRVVRAT